MQINTKSKVRFESCMKYCLAKIATYFVIFLCFCIKTLSDSKVSNCWRMWGSSQSLAENISTERLKWRPMLRQRRESVFCQTLQVHITCDTQKIQSSDWPKWRCTLWRNVNSRLLWDMGCHFKRSVRYVG